MQSVRWLPVRQLSRLQPRFPSTNGNLSRSAQRATGLFRHHNNHTTNQTRSMVVITKTKAEEVPLAPQQGVRNSPPPPPQDSNTTPADTSSEGLIITEACWKQILRLAARKEVPPSDMFLRVFVDAGGCSGFEYKFEVETDPEALEEDDLIWQGPEGARVVVDESSLAFIKGATLDYVVEMIKSAFTVKDNPQSEAACGCGSSFAVKNFSANPALD
eukprot:scaffold8318_cov175-Amphora_coffeaeformis.AAC.2